MKKKFILLLSACCIALGTYAQKVEIDTRIINCSDMPVGLYTSVKRRCPVPDHEKDDRLNQTVYQRFEVAKGNHQNVALGTDRNEAKRLCASYQESVNDKGKWRLPTYRELALIWILQPALLKYRTTSGYTSMGVTTNENNAYYSATHNANITFKIRDAVDYIPDSYYSGSTTTDDSHNLVRCIRDLDI